MKSVSSFCTVVVATLAIFASGTASAAVFTFTAPSLDRYMYPFISGPDGATRTAVPTFGAVGSPDFDDRDSQFLMGYNTTSQIAPGLGAGNYIITAARLTVRVGGDPLDPPAFVYDPTYDSWQTYGDTPAVADGDAGRPAELHGVGFRNGFTGFGYTSSPTPDTPPLFRENTSFGDPSRNAYALGFDGAGVARDVSENVAGGFESNPWAVGQTTAVAAGQGVSNGSDFTFDINLSLPGVLQYLQNGLNNGSLGFTLTGLFPASFGGPQTYPRWYTKDSVGVAADGFAPLLEITVGTTGPVRWGGASGAYATGGNWVGGVAPTANDEVVFDAPGTSTATLGISPTHKRIDVQGSADVTLAMAGHSYTLTDNPTLSSVMVGKVAGDNAKLTFSGGVVNGIDASIGAVNGTTGLLRLSGAGAVLSFSSSVNVGGAGSTGTLQLDLGTSTQIAGALFVGAGGTVDASGSLSANVISNHGNFSHSNDSLTIQSQFNNLAGAATIGGVQSWAAGAALNVAGGQVTLESNIGTAGSPTVQLSATGGQTQLAATQHLLSASISGAGKVQLKTSAGSDGGLVLVTGDAVAGTSNGGLAFGGSTDNWSGQLDLGANAAVLKFDDDANTLLGADRVFNQVKNGFNGFLWDGQGIISSAALNDPNALTTVGMLNNNDGFGGELFYGDGTVNPQFSGETVTAQSVLLKYTYFGDANLDGIVDGTDYALIDNGLTFELTGWQNGDFDYSYDGVDPLTAVDGTDYALIDNAFTFQGGPLASGAGAAISAVPEPSTWVMLVTGLAVAVIATRRRWSWPGSYRFFCKKGS